MKKYVFMLKDEILKYKKVLKDLIKLMPKKKREKAEL